MDQSNREASSQLPVSRDQVEIAERQARANGSALLDNLEASRREQGNYFHEIGKTFKIEAPNEGDKDPRVIIFKTPVSIKEGEDPRAVIITQDGPFYVSGGTTYTEVGEGGQEFYISDGKHFNNGSETFIKRMEEVQNNLNTGEYIPESDGKPAFISTHGYGSHERRMEFELLPITELDPVMKARDESIKNTESPHKVKLEAVQVKTNLINSLSSNISQLPPRG